MRLVPLAAGVAAVVVVLAARAAQGGTDGEAPAAGGATIAGTCPATWADTVVTATRTGPLVPTGARSALLCSYPDPEYTLSATRRMIDGVGNLTGYLNGLPASRDPDTHCALSANTEHIIVFEYAGRQPVVAYARNCAWDQNGAVRYHGDIRKITAYWSVTFRD